MRATHIAPEGATHVTAAQTRTIPTARPLRLTAFVAQNTFDWSDPNLAVGIGMLLIN